MSQWSPGLLRRRLPLPAPWLRFHVVPAPVRKVGPLRTQRRVELTACPGVRRCRRRGAQQPKTDAGRVCSAALGAGGTIASGTVAASGSGAAPSSSAADASAAVTRKWPSRRGSKGTRTSCSSGTVTSRCHTTRSAKARACRRPCRAARSPAGAVPRPPTGEEVTAGAVGGEEHRRKALLAGVAAHLIEPKGVLHPRGPDFDGDGLHGREVWLGVSPSAGGWKALNTSRFTVHAGGRCMLERLLAKRRPRASRNCSTNQ